MSVKYPPYLSADVYTCIRRVAKTLLHALCNTTMKMVMMMMMAMLRIHMHKTASENPQEYISSFQNEQRKTYCTEYTAFMTIGEFPFCI